MRVAQAFAMTILLRTTAAFLGRPLASSLSVASRNSIMRPSHLRLMMISTEIRGAPDTEEFRVFFKVSRPYGWWLLLVSKRSQHTYAHGLQKDGKEVSPWHDIPLSAGQGTFNMVTEIPKL